MIVKEAIRVIFHRHFWTEYFLTLTNRSLNQGTNAACADLGDLHHPAQNNQNY